MAFEETVQVFFFSSRRRQTRWTGDWSSDVCSTDLPDVVQSSGLSVESSDEVASDLDADLIAALHAQAAGLHNIRALVSVVLDPASSHYPRWREIGRASCRERGHTSVAAVTSKENLT